MRCVCNFITLCTHTSPAVSTVEVAVLDCEIHLCVSSTLSLSELTRTFSFWLDRFTSLFCLRKVVRRTLSFAINVRTEKPQTSWNVFMYFFLIFSLSVSRTLYWRMQNSRQTFVIYQDFLMSSLLCNTSLKYT